MLTSVKSLSGFNLKGIDGDFGTVLEFLFDDQHWAVRYLVADTGAWLTDRQVLLSPYSLGAIDKPKRHIGVKLTRKQIEESPVLSSDLPVSKQFESLYHAYYGWPNYWAGSYIWGMQAIPLVGLENPKHENSDGTQWNPHLRSTLAVGKYTIESTEGEIGRVVDFIVDEESWAICYMVVATGNWWQGKHVLIAARWIDKVSWDEGKVFVNLKRDQIRNSPEYNTLGAITREYELELHGHFNREGYWVDQKTSGPPS